MTSTHADGTRAAGQGRRVRIREPSRWPGSIPESNSSDRLDSVAESGTYDARSDRVPVPAPAHGDLHQMETVHGHHPGDRYVRVKRHRSFRRAGAGHLVLARGVGGPKGRLGRLFAAFKRLLVGRPLMTAEEPHERVNVFTGLAVFASDNISSSAYATEEIMRVLVLAGAGALALTLPITIVIVAVLAIVVLSYQQTIGAYPSGGGSYIVASDNLGPLAGLTAAGALLTDYVLTVSVSIAAGVAALTSIFPGLFEYRVAAGIACVAILCLGNLRGIRESGAIFTAPCYVYLVAIFGLLGYGFFLYTSGGLPPYEAPAAWSEAHGTESLGLLLILRAFASGSVALTGTEAVSNGVPAFKPPEPRHAKIVLVLMGTFFGSIFLGMSFLAGQLGILPDPTEEETVVSQLTRTLVGDNTPYHYLVQLSTALLLVLAANTAFADFPRLSSILGRDRFLPRLFAFRGDRLAFTSGIVLLAAIAAGLIVAFEGSVTNLIPLYTVGVFIAFTLSQAGMVQHWWRLRGQERGWQLRAGINGLGAVTTSIVAIEVGFSKFALGACDRRRKRARSAGDRVCPRRRRRWAGDCGARDGQPRGRRASARRLGALRGSGRGARGARIPVPIPHGPAAGLHRRASRDLSTRHDRRGPARVRARPLVGAPASQSDRSPAQSPAPVPPRPYRGQRALPPWRGQARGKGLANL